METRPIPDAPGYFAREDGVIFGPGGNRHRAGPRALKLQFDRYGYFYIHIWLNGVRRQAPVSRLIALAFHGAPPSPRHHAAHRDGNPLHNVPGNVYWATPKENAADRERHGRTVKGERHPDARLTDALVIDARRQHAEGRSIRGMAKELGVDPKTLRDALLGKTWAHVGSTL